MDKYLFSFFPALLLICLSCQSNQEVNSIPIIVESSAAIVKVTCTGGAGNYTLDVTIESPDTGCDQYADWWEVISPAGELIYRRILGHSHVDEQPFTRSGGPVDIGAKEEIIIRAHMNNMSYGTQVFRGNVSDELRPDSLSVDFAIELETMEPLPGDCAF